jgi:hypothetical protein
MVPALAVSERTASQPVGIEHLEAALIGAYGIRSD